MLWETGGFVEFLEERGDVGIIGGKVSKTKLSEPLSKYKQMIQGRKKKL